MIRHLSEANVRGAGETERGKWEEENGEGKLWPSPLRLDETNERTDDAVKQRDKIFRKRLDPSERFSRFDAPSPATASSSATAHSRKDPTNHQPS
jgi:hypothetical protein